MNYCNDNSLDSRTQVWYAKIIIQGLDFKSRAWMRSAKSKSVHFNNVRGLLREVLSFERKCCIFRYLNSESSLLRELIYTFVLVTLCHARRLFRLDIYWILHNVDKETTDNYPKLTRFKRWTLGLTAKKIFVTDPIFVPECEQYHPKVFPISFGPKFNGTIKQETITKIQAFSKKFDLVVLCLGAVGPKYKHFSNLDALTNLAGSVNKSIGLVLSAGVFKPAANVCLVHEDNIDESKVAAYVDGIYRINDDISMPFTLYAACTARIPLISDEQSWTHKIIQRYGIGFSEQDFLLADNKKILQVRQNMERFLSQKQWDSLTKCIYEGV